MSLITLLTDFQKEIEQPERLNVQAMLGYPDLGRSEAQLPQVAVTWMDSGYANQSASGIPTASPYKRLGQVPAIGRSVSLRLYIAATHERELLGIVDQLLTMRDDLRGLTSESLNWVVLWGTPRRSDLAGLMPEERMLAYVVECDVLLTSK